MEACRDDSGEAEFDLTLQDTAVLNGLPASDFIISYHITQEDANDNQDAVTSYVAIFDLDTVYARLQSVAILTVCLSQTLI